MSQKTENQVAEMKKQTIGVEVEMNERESRKGRRRVLRNRAASKHGLQERILLLVSLG